MVKSRNSQIEFLRILSMIFIVLSHYTFHNGVNNYELPLGFNRFLLEISTLGNIGVIIFVMISGYFFENKKTNDINMTKIFKLWCQVVFYSITIYILLLKLGYIKFSFIELIKNIFPITFKQYWFATAYFVLYLFIPFLNCFFNNIQKDIHLKFNIMLLIIFSVLRTLTNQDFYGSELIEFIMFYSFGIYIKKYLNKPTTKQRKINNICLVSSVAIIIISIIAFDIIGQKYSVIAQHSNYLLGRTSPLTITIAITIFNIFSWKKPYSNTIINAISSTMFGVYLISDNKYIRRYLWKDWLKIPNYVHSNILILHMIVSLITVFIICAFIDFLRIKLIEYPMLKKMSIKAIKITEQKKID